MTTRRRILRRAVFDFPSFNFTLPTSYFLRLRGWVGSRCGCVRRWQRVRSGGTTGRIGTAGSIGDNQRCLGLGVEGRASAGKHGFGEVQWGARFGWRFGWTHIGRG